MNTAHTHATGRNFLTFFALALLCLGLAACGDKEPEQRKAFARILEHHAATGKLIPHISPEDEKSIGPYSAHLAVIRDFNRTMAESLQKDLKDFMAFATMKSLDELAKNRSQIAKSVSVIDGAMATLTEKMAAADKARSALTTPPDVQTLYDNAYARGVTQPATLGLATFASVKDTISAVLDLLDFVEKNKDTMDINGQMIEVRDEKLQKPLAELLDVIREKQNATVQAVRDLNALRSK